MNATFDEVEREWKAIEVGNTVGDRTFYEAHFNHLLAEQLEAAGYGIRRMDSHFELASVSRELVQKFSRRTKLIEQQAREKYTVLEARARALMKSTGMAFDDAFAHVREAMRKRGLLSGDKHKVTRLSRLNLTEGASPLIVAPTHAECRAIAARVRELQKAVCLVSPEEHQVVRLERLNLTESQRRDAINYHAGQVVEFHRRARGGFKSGEKWEVIAPDENGVIISRVGKQALLPLAQTKSFELYERREIALAAGDSVRITKNFRCGADRFTNNELCRVAAIDDAGIHLEDTRLIKATEAVHLDQGIAVTSHASQGKTLDQVIVSIPVSAFSQANQAQFYVSMSRARRAMYLYTDSKAALKEAVMRPSQRLSAAELIEELESGPKNGGVLGVESREKAVLCLGDSTGRREIPCEILRETSHCLVIRLQANCLMPGGRRGTKGQELRVPKYAIRREEQELTR